MHDVPISYHETLDVLCFDVQVNAIECTRLLYSTDLVLIIMFTADQIMYPRRSGKSGAGLSESIYLLIDSSVTTDYLVESTNSPI